MFRAGRQIGPYTLVSRIGRGGFGEVWLAERRARYATTRVAVKLPLDEQVDHAAIEQEAQLWAQASGHPNVLPIIEADDYDGQTVIVSEYAPDGSLEHLLERNGGPLSLKRAVELTVGILNGLEFLHSRKIIHRDLKPANILMQGDTPRLADFGISRAMRTTAVSASIGGTPLYMAPEAFDGERTARTDIWSVGVLLYQMLAGRLPFPQESYGELIAAIISKKPAALPKTIPDAVRGVVFKALAKPPAERYASATEMRDELHEAWLAHSRPYVPPPRPAPPAPVVAPDAPTLRDAAPWKTNGLRRFIIPAAGLLLVIFAGYAYWSQTAPRPEAAGASGVAPVGSSPSPSPTRSQAAAAGTLVPYLRGDKMGFSDENRRLVIEPKYDSVFFFNEGLAAVTVNRKIGFIDKEGTEVVAPKYDLGDIRNLSFMEGRALVKFDGRYGFIDKRGVELTPLKYEDAQPFHDGFAVVKLNGKYGFIDKQGEEITSLKYERVQPFWEGMAMVELDDKHGFIDGTGKEVITLKYQSAGVFSGGLAPASPVGGPSVYIDKTGREVIRLRADLSPGNFSEGLARVSTFSPKVAYGYIDTTGKVVIPLKYDNGFDFKDGFAIVTRDKKHGFIDKTGKEITPLKYEDAKPFADSMAAVKLGGKWGFVDTTGREVITLKYDRTLSFHDGVTFVGAGAKNFFIDKTGREFYEH